MTFADVPFSAGGVLYAPHIALARELRDRFLEQVNGDPGLLLPGAKYEVARALPEAPTQQANVIEVKALPEAA